MSCGYCKCTPVLAAYFTAFLALTLVHVAHFSKSIHVAQDSVNWFLLWGGIVSYKLNWVIGMQLWVHMDSNGTPFCDDEVLILTLCI